MKTKLLFFLLLIGGAFSPLNADSPGESQVILEVGQVDPTSTTHGMPRQIIPYITLENSTLTLPSGHDDYALQLINEDGEIVYSLIVPSATTTAILPSWLSGDFIIRLYPTGSGIYFFGWIEL